MKNLVQNRNITEDYDLIELLSQGDFSSVVKAIRKKDNQVFAIKIFEG